MNNTYDFSGSIQTQIVALVLRDIDFLKRTEGLIKPEYFENEIEGILIKIASTYYEKYNTKISIPVLIKIIKDKVESKLIRKDLLPLLKEKIQEIYNETDVSQKDFLIEQASNFAKHQAVQDAILSSYELLEKGDFSKIEASMRKALDTGSASSFEIYDYWANIDKRTKERKALLSGEMMPRGITTGIKELDDMLKCKGWGRKQFSLLMGCAKAGKTMGLGDFAKFASLAGFNVLYVTLEVSPEDIADRIDSNIADILTKEVGNSDKILEIQDKINEAALRGGRFDIQEFPMGEMKPSDLRRLYLNRQAKLGLNYDLVVVDYADIMAPEIRTGDKIEDSCSIYRNLRAFAQVYNVALLSATQTNRDGAKSAIAKATDVADDYNKIRIADIVISINATPDEKSQNMARLYFAASRHQEGDFTINIQQDLARGKFIKKVFGRV